ncbi:septum formation initiator family protein [Starkeya sp. 3C]|uniref:Septum formation initiator family protein n=1 Tax=Ancylobacter moscoviensis TaxID=2597768 RepID=A0ABY3DPF5_9HYPH|nr:septum formation initiator family protein [Ancylobacter moscoviensis]TSJ61482.1 septum formation initiator family protein [Ancylobacter moscoviensis]
MIIRTRWRSIFQTVTLHLGAAALIGYFAVQGYNGQYGLIARRTFEQQHAELTEERDKLRTQRQALEAKVRLLSPDLIDADMLDEQARVLLNLINPRDLVLLRAPAAPQVQ